ncbi:SxtJ family membrane protein [Methylocella sp.]|uniref:SxtJ family membrane protein n=1 Tax=Methylocella sp. TaxID=1978226 RepID=UPI00378390DB
MQTHENDSSFRKVVLGSDRKFGLTFAAAFTAIALWPLIHRHPPRWPLLVAAVLFAAFAMAAPSRLAPLNRAWFKLGLALNKIVSPIVMGAMFFGAVVPVGWIVRMRGADLLRLKREPSEPTYWIMRDAQRYGGMTKQF